LTPIYYNGCKILQPPHPEKCVSLAKDKFGRAGVFNRLRRQKRESEQRAQERAQDFAALLEAGLREHVPQRVQELEALHFEVLDAEDKFEHTAHQLEQMRKSRLADRMVLDAFIEEHDLAEKRLISLEQALHRTCIAFFTSLPDKTK
jgi:hypothetical protein